MASNQNYLAFVLEQISEPDHITYRKMMGEYLLYYDKILFGGIYDNRFLVKPTPSACQLMPDGTLESPYVGAKPLLAITEIENKTFLKQLIAAICNDLLTASKK